MASLIALFVQSGSSAGKRMFASCVTSLYTQGAKKGFTDYNASGERTDQLRLHLWKDQSDADHRPLVTSEWGSDEKQTFT